MKKKSIRLGLLNRLLGRKRLIMSLGMLCCSLQFVLAQNERISCDFNNTKVTSIMETVQKKTGISYVYNTALIKDKKATISARNETIILPKI